MKKVVLILVLAMSLWAGQIVTKKAFMNASDTKGKSLVEVREALLMRAKKAAASEIFGDYVNSSTVTNKGKLISAEINSIVNGVIHVKGNPKYSNGENFGDMQVVATMYATSAEISQAKIRLDKVIRKFEAKQLAQEKKATKAAARAEKKHSGKKSADSDKCNEKNLPTDPFERQQAAAECAMNMLDSDFD